MAWARTATQSEVTARLGATGEQGISLGRYYDDKNGRVGDKIIYGGERHLLVIGPNGTGKGTRFLIPNLLTLADRSIIVIDPKGELAAVTADFRRTVGDVVILNPFDVLGLGSAGFNPLASLDPKSVTFYDDAAAIGEALIQIEKHADSHWSESAQGLLVALMMWERLRNGSKANLENVRAMLTEADRTEEYVGPHGKPHERLIAGLRITAADMVNKGGYAIASLAGRFTEESRELASIRSTADTQTRWLLSEPMRVDLKKPGFDFAQLKKRPTTVYVILPAERMRTHCAWLRLVIVSALRALYHPGGLRTLMLIDEMPTLGRLGPLEEAFALVRGYRVQIAGILQDLNQLKQLYEARWETFMANAGVVLGFTPNDLTTAEWMSRRSGQATFDAEGTSENVSLSPSGGSTGEGTSRNQIGRALYLPHDLMGFDEGMGLLWLAGMANGVTCFAPPYWKIAQCEQRASANPYFGG